jgi:uncharacterized membrane protein
MNLSTDNLTLPFIVAGWLLFLGSLFWALKTAPWHKIESDKGAQHVLLAAVVVVFFVWQISASLGEGLTFHFLFMTVLTLMFSPQFALIGMSLALMGVTFEGHLGWLSFGLNGVVMGLLPIMITALMLKASNRFLDKNFFVYLLFNAFLAAAVGVVVSLSVGAWILWVSGAHRLDVLKQTFLPFIPLMAVPEGFVNGMIILVMILLKPQWVSSFRDQDYFKKS